MYTQKIQTQHPFTVTISADEASFYYPSTNEVYYLVSTPTDFLEADKINAETQLSTEGFIKIEQTYFDDIIVTISTEYKVLIVTTNAGNFTYLYLHAPIINISK